MAAAGKGTGAVATFLETGIHPPPASPGPDPLGAVEKVFRLSLAERLAIPLGGGRRLEKF